MNELALFAGGGGGILGGMLLGWRTVCAVEYEPSARRMLIARQDDGCLDPFPIWDDVRTFDGKPWRGIVDVVSGGFPCQDISAAGKGAGLDGERSGLWSEMSRIIGEVRPRFALVENSPVLTSRGLGTVLGDLAAMGYDAQWGVLGAVHAGAPHKRERIWIVAHAEDDGDGWREQQPGSGESSRHVADAHQMRRNRRGREIGQAKGRGQSADRRENVADTNSLRELQPQRGEQNQRGRTGNRGASLSDTGGERGQLSAKWKLTTIEQPGSDGEARSTGRITNEWWATEPDVGRVAHGVASRVDRLRCIGNGQVPAVVQLAWNLLKPKL